MWLSKASSRERDPSARVRSTASSLTKSRLVSSHGAALDAESAAPEISLDHPASEKESKLLFPAPPAPALPSMEPFRCCLERRRLTSISRSSRSPHEESNDMPWFGEAAHAGAAAAARELTDGGAPPPVPSGLIWSSSSDAATAAPEGGDEGLAASPGAISGEEASESTAGRDSARKSRSTSPAPSSYVRSRPGRESPLPSGRMNSA
nr:unnamed protein product [Digitaria exilis]